MPIGNQEIWDKGIGAGATNVVFGGGDTQPSSTNFNPGALGADPTQKPADQAAPAVPAVPAAPATTGASALAQGTGQQQSGKNPDHAPYAKNLKNAQLKMQQLQQQLQFALNENERANIQYRMNQQLKEIQKWETANANWGY